MFHAEAHFSRRPQSGFAFFSPFLPTLVLLHYIALQKSTCTHVTVYIVQARRLEGFAEINSHTMCTHVQARRPSLMSSVVVGHLQIVGTTSN